MQDFRDLSQHLELLPKANRKQLIHAHKVRVLVSIKVFMVLPLEVGIVFVQLYFWFKKSLGNTLLT